MKAKRFLALFTVVCSVIAMTGCLQTHPENNTKPQNADAITENTQPVTENNSALSFIEIMTGDAFLEEWYENENSVIIKWQKLKLSEAHSKLYPKLSSALESYNRESLADSEEIMKDMTDIAKDLPEEEAPTNLYAESSVHMQRADNRIISFIENVTRYYGGVHPDYYVVSANYNPETGKALKLKDILTDTDKLPEILEKKLTEKHSHINFSELKDTLSKYKPEEFTWTVDYQGITFWFSPYEIAAFVFGTLSAKIYFDEYPGMFASEYTEAPENYALSLPFNINTDFDLTEDDGKEDIIYTETTPDNYGGSYNLFSVTVNSNTYTDEINYAYYYDVYLVHMKNKNYICYDSKTDNDYHIICMIDIEKDGISQIGEYYGKEFSGTYIEEGFETGTVYRTVFNNPDEFMLTTRMNLLGTRDGKSRYRINESDGSLEMTDEYYNIESEFGLNSSVSFEAELLPGKEKTVFPEGTTFYPLRTDGKTYIDMKTENGREVRINYDSEDFPHKVNGIPEDECFNNIMYAG